MLRSKLPKNINATHLQKRCRESVLDDRTRSSQRGFLEVFVNAMFRARLKVTHLSLSPAGNWIIVGFADGFRSRPVPVCGWNYPQL